MSIEAEDEVSTRLIGRETTLLLPAAQLVVLEGPDRGKQIRITQGKTRIGAAPGNHLVLTDPTVSRVHCEIDLRRDRIRVSDSGSTNGTVVDGVRVIAAEVTAGAVLRLGATAIRLDAGEDSVEIPLSRRNKLGDVVGGSVEMRRIFAIMEKVAPTDATVLIQGETGTGKELVARAIHQESARAKAPLVAIDCGAIAASLIESELFGHVRGAFSGAVADRKGLFEAAQGGTLFLDEVGELPVALQPKLLRVLETRQVRRLGSNHNQPVDVRVVAATNRPLSHAVNEGSFREDLYYRLAVVELFLPPLRARREDIPMLARLFWERFTGSSQPPPTQLVSTLLTRAWPGNVRELRNFIERTVSLLPLSGGGAETKARGPVLPEGLEALVPVHLPLIEARVAWMEQFEHVYLRALLDKTGGNVTRAAELAGVSRRFLQRMMVRLGVRRSDGGLVEADDGDGGDSSALDDEQSR